MDTVTDTLLDTVTVTERHGHGTVKTRKSCKLGIVTVLIKRSKNLDFTVLYGKFDRKLIHWYNSVAKLNLTGTIFIYL